MTASTPKTIALAGNPNAGKTTLFNALTGLRQKTGNYAGVTVEKRTGVCRLPDGSSFDIIDLPGTYSLIARSPDEKIAVDVLCGRAPGTPRPDAIVVVVDASNLQRNLYLLSQFIETGLPIVVALNMMDIAERRGTRVSAPDLALKLGVPVVPIVAHKGRGIEELKLAIAQARPTSEPDWPLPEAFKREIDQLQPRVSELAAANGLTPRALAERLLVGEQPVAPLSVELKSVVDASRVKLMSQGIDPIQTDVEAHYKWIEQLSESVTSPTFELKIRGSGVRNPKSLDLARPRPERKQTLSDTLDKIFLHKVVGLALFAIIMGSVFVSLFWIADPIMGAVESAVGASGAWVGKFLPDGPLKDMWLDGIVAGVGGVMVFIPQIAILFAFLAVLEDSGYLARAAFLMDRILAKVGLSGKAFVPLLSSFACAIPGIMATRTMESRRDRLATIFVAPFMSCSARLPVYGLLIGTFFAGYSAIAQGGILLALYLLGIIAAFGTGWVFKKTLLKGSPASFILELPSYKVPQLSQVVRSVVTNTWAFIAKAGTIIFCLSVVLWAMTYWPKPSDEQVTAFGDSVRKNDTAEVEQMLVESKRQANLQTIDEGAKSSRDIDLDWQPLDPREGTAVDREAFQKELDEAMEAHVEKEVAAEKLRYSIAGRLGRALEPVIAPLGYDWKMGIGLVGAFAAREVFVSTLAIVYAAGDEEDTQPLSTAMLADRYENGRPVWTPLVAISLLIWFVLAMQCLSTLAIVKRETGGWAWPIAQLLYMNGLAYVLCLIVFQVGVRMGL
jgi:ferrous iron transport protein B